MSVTIKKALPSGDRCGAPRAVDDHCSVYYYARNIKRVQCTTCDPGYSIKLVGAKAPFCVKATLLDCRVETIFDAGLDAGTYCQACTNGKYSVTTQRTPQRVASCKTVTTTVPNCRYGGYVTGGSPSCYKCNPGFSLHYGPSGNGVCIKAPVAGCWVSQNGRCQVCDPEQGYSINKAGVCFK